MTTSQQLPPEALFSDERQHCPLCSRRGVYTVKLPRINGHDRVQATCLNPDGCDYFQVAGRDAQGKCIALDGLEDRPPAMKRPEEEVQAERERSPEAMTERLRNLWRSQPDDRPLEQRVQTVLDALEPGSSVILRDMFDGNGAASSEAKRIAFKAPDLTYVKGNRWGPARIINQQPEQRTDPPLQNSHHPDSGPGADAASAPAQRTGGTDRDHGGEQSSAPALGKSKPKAGAETSKSAAADSPVASDPNVQTSKGGNHGEDRPGSESGGDSTGCTRTGADSIHPQPSPSMGDAADRAGRAVHQTAEGDDDDRAVSATVSSEHPGGGRTLTRLEYLRCVGLLAVAWRMNEAIDEIHSCMKDALGTDDDESWLIEFIYNTDSQQEPAAALGAMLDRMQIKVEDR